MLPTLPLLLVLTAGAQELPDTQIPPHVMAELAQIEDAFEVALASDCNAELCFPKGCAYVDHTVTDRPRRRSMPGLGDEWGPGSVEAQEFLTRASCSYAYEESLDAKDVSTLSRRLEARVSKGWVVVSVSAQKIQPLPAYVAEPPPPVEDDEAVEEEPEPVEAPETWTAQLWAALLPHAWWMVGLFLGTLAGSLLIWSWRRLGRESIEERMLLAEIEAGGSAAALADPVEDEPVDEDAAYVREQDELWSARLDDPDPEVRALLRDLLLARDLPLLAKAVLRFPRLTATFPEGGEVAAAKLELSEYLKEVDPEDLPSDVDFFRALNRHSLSAALAVQGDAQVVRSLREEFGAAGLVDLIGSLPARPGALLFAMAPAAEQHEMVGLLSESAMTRLSEQLLASNRMDPAETRWLFDVVQAARNDTPRPTPPPSTEVTDRGTPFDAVGALSVLLPQLSPATRSQLFGSLLGRFGGRVPAWYRGLFLPDFLDLLAPEARADLLLDVEVQPLAAWVSGLSGPERDKVLQAMPTSLRTSVQASTSFADRAQQLALAAEARQDLARGFQGQLARAGMVFEHALQSRESQG